MKIKKHLQNRSHRATAGMIVATLLLSACVANQPKGAAGVGDNTQLAANLAQAALNISGNGGGTASQLVGAVAGGTAAPASAALKVDLPAKMSCKDITTRLIKTRSDAATFSGAAPAQAAAPLNGNNKLAAAAGAASLLGSLSGNSTLANAGNQLSGLTGGAAAGAQPNPYEALQAELEKRAALQKCKVPNATLPAAVQPSATVKLSCGQLKQELKALHNTPAPTPVAAAAVAPAAPMIPAGNGLGDKIQAVGALASVAGALTGNETLKTIGNLAGGDNGGAANATNAANAAAAAQASAVEMATRKATLEAQAKAQRCKI